MNADLLEFNILVDDPGLSPQQLQNVVLMFRHAIKQELDLTPQSPVPDGSKDIDPAIYAVISLTILPTILTKFLEFLHSWSMRRENHYIKIKIQMPDKTFAEIEVPQTASPDEVKKWIELTRKSLLGSGRRAKK